MKLAVVTSRFPYPLEKGDKLRLFFQLKFLSQYHSIALFALSDVPVTENDLAALRPYCSNITIFYRKKWTAIANIVRAMRKGLPMQVGYFFDPAIGKQLHAALHTAAPDHVYFQLFRMAAYAEGLPYSMTLDYMDAFATAADRWAARSLRMLRPVLRWEATAIRRYETAIYQQFRHHTVISAQDRDLLALPSQATATVIPNGVDTTFFMPMLPDTPIYDVIFVGNMGYAPNIDAAIYLVKNIMPKVWAQLPNVRVLIAGARPATIVQQLATINVTISGWLPDIRTAYRNGTLFVAPLWMGAGRQNKILEAMAMGLPCLTTPLVNNAIGAIPNKAIVLANDANDFATQIVNLLHDKTYRQQIATNGLSFVRNNFSWMTFVERLNNLLTSV